MAARFKYGRARPAFAAEWYRVRVDADGSIAGEFSDLLAALIVFIGIKSCAPLRKDGASH